MWLMARLKTDGFTVEFQPLDLDHIKTEAIVNPTDSRLSGSGGLDKIVHQKAGPGLALACKMADDLECGSVIVTAGYSLPVKAIVHAVVPVYKPGSEEILVNCYLKCLAAVTFGDKKCGSITIPLLGTGSRGWTPEISMKCAWRAVCLYASENAGIFFESPEKLRTIIFGCDPKEYPWAEEYRMNAGNLFFTVPEQWNMHGDLFFWWYLMERFAGYTSISFESVGFLRVLSKIFYEVTGCALEKGTVVNAKKEGYGRLCGHPITCDFWLKKAIPILLENACRLYDQNGKRNLETAEVEIDGYEWMIPADSVAFMKDFLGDEIKNRTESGKNSKNEDEDDTKTNPNPEQKISLAPKMIALKEVGLKYSPMVKKAMMICFLAHKDQTDRSGLPYVFHPFHLAEQMETEDEICTALLHDVVEDSDYTIENLSAEGFNRQVLDAVALLTHDPKVPYMNYVCALRGNALARKVKMADLKHNSDQKRTDHVTEWDKKRLQKYRIAAAILEDDRYDVSLKHYRKRIPLDDKRLHFLSVFYKMDGMVEKFSFDVEDASDMHIEFGAEGEKILVKKLDPNRSLPEILADVAKESGGQGFVRLLDKYGIKYQVLYYD